jgi:maltose O-acetyltransferase
MAEIESAFGGADKLLFWRRQELKSLGVQFGEPVWIGQHLRILKSGNIVLGKRVALPFNTQLVNYSPITIGDDFIAASDLIINTGTHDPVTMNPSSKEVHIGNRVWCGVRVTILAGVTIGDDVVIGAGSLVNKDIPNNVLVAGVPARIIRPLDRSNVKKIWSQANPKQKAQLFDVDA